MRGFKFFINLLVVCLLLVGVGIFVVTNFSWIFSKNVQGEVIEIERITSPEAILGQVTRSHLHSYAVLIQDREGVMYTASSEDRQWQVVKKGFCVLATLYRYPPWDLERGGTFYNARLKQVYKCPGKPSQEIEVEKDPSDEILGTESLIEGEAI